MQAASLENKERPNEVNYEIKDEEAIREATDFRNKSFGTTIPERLHRLALEKCGERGENPSTYLRRLIVQDLRAPKTKALGEDSPKAESAQVESYFLDILNELDLMRQRMKSLEESRAKPGVVDQSAKEDVQEKQNTHVERPSYAPDAQVVDAVKESCDWLGGFLMEKCIQNLQNLGLTEKDLSPEQLGLIFNRYKEHADYWGYDEDRKRRELEELGRGLGCEPPSDMARAFSNHWVIDS